MATENGFTPAEVERRRQVMQQILDDIAAGRRICLPPVDHSISRDPDLPAGVVLEPNPYGGQVRGFRYQFEGEDDLLHLAITRLNGLPIAPGEGQSVAAFLLDGVSPPLVWFKPGVMSQHFYVGHDDLVGSLKL